MTIAVNAENLTVARGERDIISGLSFRVGSGEALLLTGANGAGKTTLLRAIAGFLPAASGSVELKGGSDENTLGEVCHYVGHLNGIKASFTVAENLEFWAEYLGGTSDSADRVQTALAAFQLTPLAGIPVAYLSAGQKRRAGLARLMAAERPVWLLDEPTASLDTESSRLLVTAVNAHTSQGGIAICATHLPLGLNRARELKLGHEAALV